MPDTTPSSRARQAAAFRLSASRLAAAYGDPAADEALARDIAGDLAADGDGAMTGSGEPTQRYRQARIAFFDRVVVNAMNRSVAQVVVAGPGYDGRALRYAKPGVRWWEVDDPDVQADKLVRLRRLGIDACHVTFIARDLAAAGLATSFVATGFEPDAPALFVCDGGIQGLSRAGLCALLRDARSLSTPGTRLCICAAPRQSAADQGNSPDGGELADMLDHSRWRPIEISERAQRAGFAVAAPMPAPASTDPGSTASLGRVAQFTERMLYRSGAATLAGHLESTYGVPVTKLRELDLGVHRVDLVDGRSWIARVYPAARTVRAVADDARLLGWLASTGFPAERAARPDPVSEHEGQGVLVSNFAPGRFVPSTAASFEILGRLLGRLHSLPAGRSPAQRPGGAWHHLLLDGSPAEEITALAELLHDARHRVPAGDGHCYEVLVDAVGSLDGCADLPQAFVHPDFVPRNVIIQPDGEPVVIDWTGSGLGPRIVSLGCLLWTAPGEKSIARALHGYREYVAIEPGESERLVPAMRLRPLVLACWMFATGRNTIRGASDWWEQQSRRVDAAADQARTIIGSGAVVLAHNSAKLSVKPAVRARERRPMTMPSIAGALITENLEYDGGRQVTVYVPPDPAEAVVFAGDGQLIAQWSESLEAADVRSTMVVGVHRLSDETLRLHEYSPGFEPDRFAAHENFFVYDVRGWVRARFGVAMPAERTAVFGVSAGGELALALGLRHPDVYSVIFCASPGGGYKPPGFMPGPLPRTYLVAGTQEPFFRENATRWATALRDAGADVVMTERAGTHGDPFWQEELPLMVAWAFAS